MSTQRRTGRATGTTWGVGEDEIVLSLQGGLGNQLFQFAFGRQLTADGRRVRFDRVRLRGERPYALGRLIPRDDLVPRVHGAVLAAAERLGRVDEESRLRLVRQRRSGYDAELVANLHAPAYLLGYFQSPAYFAGVADEVRASVLSHLRDLLTPEGRELARDWEADPTTVAVHVRRGDYLSDAAAAARHGVLDRGYYDRALQVAEDHGCTRRVWFSDDPAWVSQNLARRGDRVCPPDATIADGGEIALMAACAGRITANSSFSWWGGWLGAPSTPHHPVIAPVVWFAGGHSDASDLVPREWMRL